MAHPSSIYLSVSPSVPVHLVQAGYQQPIYSKLACCLEPKRLIRAPKRNPIAHGSNPPPSSPNGAKSSSALPYRP
ncbi:uncharacterized [Tachysurus ichikawai]